MFSSTASISALLGEFHIEEAMMRYSVFVPRLYNYCKQLGFTPGKIMPSRAFCSDESQGYPIILLTKHFGTFPFNHGRVGGIVATDRHGPHAEHGKDLVIIQASHVGYDPVTKTFGSYHRKQTVGNQVTSSCGKIEHVLEWYQNEYRFARENIFLQREGGELLIIIDNQLLNDSRDEGLFLNLKKMLRPDSGGDFLPIRSLSTAKCYYASKEMTETIGAKLTGNNPMEIGEHLTPDLFSYKRIIKNDAEGYNHLERNLLGPMSWIVASPQPMLTAAQINTQSEFDRAYRTIVKAQCYRGKRLLFIAGINIDISPPEDQLFPLTKFVPWAACVQEENGHHYTLEQSELVGLLKQQPLDNEDEVDLESAITTMERAEEVKIKTPHKF